MGKITPEEKPRSLKERGPFRCSRSMQRRVAGQGLHGEDGKQHSYAAGPRWTPAWQRTMTSAPAILPELSSLKTPAH